MSTTITQVRPDHPDATALIEELEAHLATIYPIESRHGLSIQRLIDENVAFFVVRDGGEPAGCGGVKLFGAEFAELKRMYVRPQCRGRGFGKLLLNQLAQHAQQCGVNLLRLETGVHQHDAIAMYERYGFVRIPPFGPYREDPLSWCYEKQL